MASITQDSRKTTRIGRRSMTASFFETPAKLSTAETRAERIATFAYSRAFLVWIYAVQLLYLGAMTWAVIVPDSNAGVITLLNRDMDHGGLLLAFTFVFGLAVGWRADKANRLYALVLVGQLAYALVTLVYVLRGETSILSLGVHGGLFLIHLVAIVSIANTRSRPTQYAQHALMPVIALSLIVIGIGLVFAEGSAAGEFIKIEFRGDTVRYVLAGMMIFCAGLIVVNHIPAHLFFIFMMPHLAYTIIVLSLLHSDPRTSLVGVIGNVAFFLSTLFISFIQMQQYTRTQIEARNQS